MPKEVGMAQLSRPFQIALVAFGLLVAVWFLALHGHSSSSGSGSTPSGARPANPGPAAVNPAAPSHVYTGPAPGVSGLTKAIAKAHEAVATSQQNAAQLQQKSAEASSAAAPAAASPTGAAAAPASAAPAAGARTSSTPSAAPPSARKPAVPSRATSAVSGPQRAVEAELKQGKIVVLLFWNGKGADDVVTHRALQLLVKLHHQASNAKVEELRHADKFFGLELDKAIAVHEGPAKSVASYGTITRGVQVYGTPTVLIVNSRHTASTLTGALDAYSIEQAIEEARHT
jgi:hypothetical protein